MWNVTRHPDGGARGGPGLPEVAETGALTEFVARGPSCSARPATLAPAPRRRSRATPADGLRRPATGRRRGTGRRRRACLRGARTASPPRLAGRSPCTAVGSSGGSSMSGTLRDESRFFLTARRYALWSSDSSMRRVPIDAPCSARSASYSSKRSPRRTARAFSPKSVRKCLKEHLMVSIDRRRFFLWSASSSRKRSRSVTRSSSGALVPSFTARRSLPHARLTDGWPPRTCRSSP